MTQGWLNALKQSIVNWKNNPLEEECPLCDYGSTINLYNPCLNCPVNIKTRAENCDNTPYYLIRDGGSDTEEEIKEMISILESCLPEE